ncbi:MAG: AAA family ATPase [Candidatus Delongbacteria bacterium]|nr:AAA family ATPase [Candidatus Delongbacteria bacterium]
MIQRKIYKTLLEWKLENNRRPILLRGARQIGKTYIVDFFGKNEFKNIISLNFERNPEYINIFDSVIPDEIIEKIMLFTGQDIIPGKTLIFLDEIQECPKAITSLRYFYEEKPDIHIIGAGSLLEFTLRKENIKMPVGRIQYLYMYPLTFHEFIDALGESKLGSYISSLDNLKNIPNALHDKLNGLVRKYFIIGGMPAVVREYVESGNIIKCQKIQRSIIDTYSDDFAKYASGSKHLNLSKIFDAVPNMIGQKFIYARVDNSIKSRDLKEAVTLLETAGIITRVKRTSGAGIPLESGVKDNYFKLVFLDVGILQAISGIYGETAKESDLTAIFKGAVAEQFVGQEILSLNNPYRRSSLFYWARESKSSNAEVDYLIQLNDKILPVEVKSGTIGKMKSMQLYYKEYNPVNGIKISQSPYGIIDKTISLPLYAIELLFLQ